MVFQVHINKPAPQRMEGDGYDEDNDVDQQESLPRGVSRIKILATPPKR